MAWLGDRGHRSLRDVWAACLYCAMTDNQAPGHGIARTPRDRQLQQLDVLNAAISRFPLRYELLDQEWLARWQDALDGLAAEIRNFGDGDISWVRTAALSRGEARLRLATLRPGRNVLDRFVRGINVAALGDCYAKLLSGGRHKVSGGRWSVEQDMYPFTKAIMALAPGAPSVLAGFTLIGQRRDALVSGLGNPRHIDTQIGTADPSQLVIGGEIAPCVTAGSAGLVSGTIDRLL